MFKIQDKVALISGGASGIGLEYGKELLRNGLRGLTLADIDENFGKNALLEIENEFGKNKAIFVRTDVTNKDNYEEAFKKTVETFKNIDILINNAGILNDKLWEKAIQINCNGVVHGTLLALEKYIPKYKTGEEGVIINISSVAGVKESPNIPVYTGTKFFVLGFSKAFGDEAHYKQTKIKVITLCPGVTDTPLVSEMRGRNLGERYEAMAEDTLKNLPPMQPKECVSKAMIKIIKNAKSGTAWIAEASQEPYEYMLTPRPNFLLN